MGVLEVIKKRRSIREFQDKKIPEEAVEKLIEAVIWAPSAGNLQARKFYFVFDDITKQKIAEAAMEQDFVATAPLVIVACTDYERIEWKYGKRGRELYCLIDTALSVENLLLVAWENGLGGTTVGAFDDDEMKKILNLPENHRPILVVPIGFPAESPEPPERVSGEEAVQIIK